MSCFLYRAKLNAKRTLARTHPPGYLFGVPIGIDIIQLFFSGRVSASVEEKPVRPQVKPVPTRRIVQTLKAIPDFAHVEKTEFDQKEARLLELEAYMDECAEPSMEFAVDVLDVVMSDVEVELLHTNYHQYAMVVIKNAEKRLRLEALLLHPDTRDPMLGVTKMPRYPI